MSSSFLPFLSLLGGPAIELVVESLTFLLYGEDGSVGERGGRRGNERQWEGERLIREMITYATQTFPNRGAGKVLSLHLFSLFSLFSPSPSLAYSRFFSPPATPLKW